MPGFRRIPQFIWDQIELLTSDDFYVGMTRSYEKDELAEGLLDHLGIGGSDGSLEIPNSVLPDPTNGRWSRWNVEGRWVTRKDLNKRPKTWGWDSPNFGDWSKGSHWISFTRDVYPREFWYGQSFPVLISSFETNPGHVTLGFRVDRVFDRTDIAERDLLMACSLLRENVGKPGILAADTSVEDWLAQQIVEWELLPVGTRDDVTFEQVAERLHSDPNGQRGQRMRSRYDVVKACGPTDIICGTSGFARYFGFKFRDDLIALENLEYGNALYLMYEDWESLSQRSRVELLADDDANFDRVVHTANWETRLRNRLIQNGHNPFRD